MRVAAIIRLTQSEVMIAAMAGVLRNVENYIMQREPRYAAACNDNQGDFQKNIIGTVGEYVVAKHLGITWPGKGLFRDSDVGDCEVRCSQGGKSLILHKEDPDEATFYFVRWRVGTFEFEVSEPVKARDAKRPQYWRTDVKCPAYFMPMD